MSASPPRSEIPRLSDLDLVIETPRLRLRPLAEGDADQLWPVVSDPNFPRYMSWAAHTDRSETIEFVRLIVERRENSTGLVWAIEHDGLASGCIGFDSIQWELRAWRLDRAELGYWLAPALWGRGLMTEAARAAVRFGFETLGLHKITVGCLEENHASRRVIEKLGFRPVGRLEDDVWRDGRWMSHLRYELLAHDCPPGPSSDP